MGKKITPGLRKRGEIWHIEKTLDGRRLFESTGTGDLAEAERFLARRLEEIRQATVYGVRPERTFEQAAVEYIQAKAHKKSIRKEVERLKQVQLWVGPIPLRKLHMGYLQPFIAQRRKDGVKSRTINWEWEVALHGLEGSGFLLPAGRFKSRYEGLVLLNRVAQSIVDAQRGKHREFVFTYRGEPITRMLNSGWQRVR